MTEKYEKSTTEIAIWCLLSVITTYNTITTVLTQAPKWRDLIVQRYENNEYRNRIPTTPKSLTYRSANQELEEYLTKTLEIDPTQIRVFDTLLEKRIK